ncbi:MAG: hypothetical protein Q8941_01285 [Bacteroidota bacterium]|nr:hypothetical protein [Bacteroidota bacterium]
MRNFKDLYYIISYSLLSVQVGFISILLYNKIVRQRVLYYGNKDEPAILTGNYFNILKFLLYSSFVLMITWALLTPLAVISNRRSMQEDRIDVIPGILGFISAVILLVIDPFGIFKWFSNQAALFILYPGWN